MENDLDIKKVKMNKQSMDSAGDVAGRKENGSMTKVLEKVTGDPSKKSQSHQGGR